MMKKFPTIFGVVILILGVIAGIWYVNSKRVDTAGELKPNNIRITNIADNKFTVSFVTEVATDAKVMYGKVGEKLSLSGVDERDSLGSSPSQYVTHYITVDDLQPSTSYAFRIATNNGRNVYDNNGSPYSVSTGPTISNTPSADTIYGQVQQSSTLPAEGAIVYLNMPSAAPASTLVKSSGAYTIPASILRSTDLKSYVQYDSQATIVTITVEQGKQQATADVGMSNAAPVPLITMGSKHDFRTPERPVAQEEPPVVAVLDTETSSPSATIPGVFNVEPLGSTSSLTAVTITNPSEEGESIASSKPEFRGKGPKSTVLSLVITSKTKTYKDTLAIPTTGIWAWTPSSELVNGTYSLSVAYIDAEGKEKSIKRSFVIDTALNSKPAFVSTPSASVKVNPTPSLVATASPSMRAAVVSTESGIPVTGVIENTLLTAIFGTVIMVVGALLLAL